MVNGTFGDCSIVQHEADAFDDDDGDDDMIT
jgi:hypothetical protein